MKCLSIQIQPELSDQFKPEDVVALSRSLGRFPEVDKENDEDPNVYLNYFTERLPALWSELEEGLYKNEELGAWLKSVSICVCEGENGWDDHLLLHHYDKSQKLDAL